MHRTHLLEIQADAIKRLLEQRSADGLWRGHLSSSAISTSVSVFALQRIDEVRYRDAIKGGVEWLHRTMKPDGSWGDSIESPSNMTATLLTYVSLYAVGQAPALTRQYLNGKFGGEREEDLIQGVLDYYGKDLTFSVPILMMCALAGVVKSWKKIPPFPFELACLPQKFFKFLNLPVVSYAIPALIAIGICQMNKKGGLTRPLRQLFVPKALRVLERMQPADGGYLEAAPLTAFVSMCMAEAGYREHPITQRCAQFLIDTLREDGAWPIDTNLSLWVTTLSGKALATQLNPSEAESLAQLIRQNATKAVHPFTGAKAGGWGWSDLSGSVPDGDDTSGALVALYRVSKGQFTQEIADGLEWLMWLQNNDGGMPTFCKGWGKLPFDRSTPDITAHAILAMGLWLPVLPDSLKARVEKSFRAMIQWMQQTVIRPDEQTSMGWNPLWFGDQDAPDEKAPVYGTATVIDYLMQTHHPEATRLARQQLPFLLSAQNEDGGWGGNKGVVSKVTFTSKALSALAHFGEEFDEVRHKGWQWMYHTYQQGRLYEAEPIGLYFSRLWYSEELYNITFLLHALNMELPLHPTNETE